MQRICGSLANAGFEVELVGRQLDSSKPLDAFPFRQTRLKCLVNKGKLFYLEYNIRLFFYLLFQKADVICATDLDTIAAGYFAARIKGAKIVYDAHEYFPEVPEVIRRPRVQKVWRWIERYFTPKADLVYTAAQSISETFEKLYQRPVYTIRNLPVLEATSNALNAKSRYLLYQGALNEGRGLEHLIESMKEIDMPLWLAGNGDLTEQLKEQVRQAGLEDKVKFLGAVKPAVLRDVTANAYIGLNLLENKGLSYYFSLANKFSDYIHAGIPQVCIDFPEYRRINDQYHVALLIENLEKDTIKTAIERLVKDEKVC
jgi:glycosyltransferase involved in cell wall biosynthesis